MKVPLTARDRGLSAAVDIQRRIDPRQWRAAVDAIEDPEERAVADDYLRSILARMKATAHFRQNPRR